MENTYLYHIMKIWNFTELKTVVLTIGASLVAYFASFSKDYLGVSGAFALAMAILILADFVSGMLASRKLKNKLTSSKGLRTVYKTGAYMVFLYIAHALQKEMPEENTEMVIKVFRYFHLYLIAHISFWELFSFDENLKVLGVNLGLTDILKGILSKIKSIFSRDE